MTEITSFWNRVEMALLKSDKKTLKDLCVRIDTPYQTMINQRAVGRYPSVDTLARMAEELDVSMDWLVTGKMGQGSSSDQQLSLSDEKRLQAVKILLSM